MSLDHRVGQTKDEKGKGKEVGRRGRGRGRMVTAGCLRSLEVNQRCEEDRVLDIPIFFLVVRLMARS